MLSIKKLNNNGSTLVIVLVVIAFISILGTITVSSAMLNLKMKEVDKESKKSFYTAEEAVDQVYAGLGIACMDSLRECYETELSSLTTELVTNNPDGSKAVKSYDHGNKSCNIEFRESYVNKLLLKLFSVQKLEDCTNENNSNSYTIPSNTKTVDSQAIKYIQYTITSYLEDENKIKIQSVGEQQLIKETSTYDNDIYNYYILIKDCKIEYKNANGYYSDVTIDCKIGLPDLIFNFVDPSSDGLTTFGEYSLIGCQGIMLSNNKELNLNQTKVYAGKSNGLQIGYKSTLDSQDSMVVSARDILLGEDLRGSHNDVTTDPVSSMFKQSGSSQLWCSNLEISEKMSNSEIDLTGSSFVQDDLTVNGDKNKAIIGGNYIGWSYENDKKVDAGKVAGDQNSSAIIVNGSNSKLDLQNVNSLILGGRSYIGVKEDSKITNKSVYVTGDSVSLKADQEIYLVPDSFLTNKKDLTGTKHFMNPVAEDLQGDVAIKFPENCFLDKHREWFVDFDNEPVVKKTVGNGEDDLVYYYLNIKKDYQDDFMNTVLDYDMSSGSDIYLAALKNLIISNTTNLQQQSLLPSSTNSAGGNIYTYGALVGADIDDGSVSGNSVADTEPNDLKNSDVICEDVDNAELNNDGFQITATDMNIRYALLCKGLYQSSFYKDDKTQAASAVVTKNRIVYGDTPLSVPYHGTYVNITGLKDDVFDNFVNQAYLSSACNKEAYVRSESNGGVEWKCYITNLDANVVTSNQNISSGLIISSGDVTVNNDFDGLIIAGKNIYIDGNATVKNSSGSIEGLIQKFNNVDQAEIRKFFKVWNKNSNPGNTDVTSLNYKNILTFDNWRNRSAE